MAYLWTLFQNVLRIVFLRGSPERIYYTRRLFIVSLILAVAASALAQWLFHGDHLVFMILRVFAELTMFMLMAVLLTRKIARFRLARMMAVMVLISLLADAVLIAASALPLAGSRDLLAYTLAAVAFYGAANSLKWGLNGAMRKALAYLGGYVAAVTGLDMAFRHLYGVIAGG